MGSRKKPVELTLLEGKYKKGKGYIVSKRETEIQLGNECLDMPEDVFQNPDALLKWNELKDLYDGFKFVTSADLDVFAQYCLCYAEYKHMQEVRQDIVDNHGLIEGYKELEKLKIDHNINKKSELLLKIGNLIFLNPVSRVKSIPLPKKEDEKPESKIAKFGL